MLRNYLLTSSFLAILLLCLSCRDSSTKPPDDQNPPGYQTDIAWPSLADSPWPMFRGNAQNTGRSKYSIPINPTIVWTDTMPGMNNTTGFTEMAIGADSTIYVGISSGGNMYGGALFAIAADGAIKWKYSFAPSCGDVETTPLVDSHGHIFICTDNQYLYCINSNGTLNWKYRVRDQIYICGIAIDKEYNIYFTDMAGYLYSVNHNGALNWEKYIDGGFAGWGGGFNISFSPDGTTMYLAGNVLNGSKSLYAVNTDGTIKWTFSNGAQLAFGPMVESGGDVYIQIDKGPDTALPYGIIRFDAAGAIKQSLKYPFSTYWAPCLDKFGNVFFTTGTWKIHCLDYKGTLKWTYDGTLDWIYSNLLCDDNGNLLVFITSLTMFNNNGSIIWRRLEGHQRSNSGPVLSYNNSILQCVLYPTKKLVCLK